MIFKRPKTNWVCLVLNKKIEINDSKAEAENKIIYSNESIANSIYPSVSRKDRICESPPEQIAANNKYTV